MADASQSFMDMFRKFGEQLHVPSFDAAKIMEQHQKNIELVKSKASITDGVVFFDLADQPLDNLNKFIAYDLYPLARYTVNVTRGASRSKVSIGSNPWHPELRTHDLSKLAEKYGGGGHPVVAAISFKPEELERARQAATEIVETLRK